ncbi:MAG: phage head closure protein, partial [Gammaproteobacteria bacterium]
ALENGRRLRGLKGTEMRSGKLKFQVTLQRRVDTQADSGQVGFSYTDIATVMADIMPGRGREFFAAAQIQAESIAEIKIRYRDDIDSTCRVVHITRYDSPEITQYWDIAAPPVPDAKTGRTDLLLYCSQGDAQGWRQ